MIQVNHLQKTYDPHNRNANTVLKDICLTLPDTGFVCILGASGCGKTSLLNAIGGLDYFQGGYVDADGTQIRPRHHRQADKLRSSSFGYIFQNYYLLPEHSVQYNVYLGLHGVKMSHREKMERVRQVLHRVDMARFAKRKVSDLSGGQQQRVAIARALAPSPKVIFADEPTGNLDEANTMNICSLLRSISRDALVVMVTHEQRLAKFFADRIITLKDGNIETDSSDWQRKPLELSDKIYTGDYLACDFDSEDIQLELYRQEDAKPVTLTVVALADRIIIKTSDQRTVICSDEAEEPIVQRGQRPKITLESLECDNAPTLYRPESTDGRLPFSWKLRETLFLIREKGFYRTGMLFFLAVLTVLSCYIYGDWRTISSVDPRDFISADSHMVEVILDRGPNMPATKYVPDYCSILLDYLNSTDIPFEFLPTVSTPATYHTDLVLQLSDISDNFGGFSYIPLRNLPEGSLVAGRMPENSQEIVMDRWVLDNYLKKDGMLQNSIPDIEFFLGKSLHYLRKNYTPTIVGICDSGECAMYLSDAGLVSLGVNGQEIIGLSELQSLFPGKYDDLTLNPDQCIMVTNNAGSNYAKEIGGVFRAKCGITFTIADAIEEATFASVIVRDDVVSDMIPAMASTKMQLYCYDKEAMLALLAIPLPNGLDEELQIEVNDHYGTAFRRYEAASRIRMDARTIVALTVIALSLVMLYLLRQSQLQKRIGMMAVYRLLGIPSGDLLAMFCGEAAIVSLLSVLPAAALTAVGIDIARRLPSLNFSMLFDGKDAALIFFAVFLFYELISLLPALWILRKPPAQIAGQIN